MILFKTEAGQRAIKDRSVIVTPRQRSAFILFDGKRSMDEVVAAGLGVTREDVEQMVALGLLVPADGAAPVVQTAAAPSPAAVAAPSPVPADTPAAAPMSHQQRYQAAYPIATRLTAALGLRGFKLNLAVEAAANWEELVGLAPKIRAAVGTDRAVELDRALGI
ncbi:hypothetical protein [Variovorax soli]|uniref:hypothetical protein n=1 Tax=Variovorax soli TaxID=376815 RepID=UPI0008392618|nr:hypothetical protein [Variovorax soli]